MRAYRRQLHSNRQARRPSASGAPFTMKRGWGDQETIAGRTLRSREPPICQPGTEACRSPDASSTGAASRWDGQRPAFS